MIAVKVPKKFESNLAMAYIDAMCRSWISYLYCTVCNKVNVKRDFGTLLQDFIVFLVYFCISDHYLLVIVPGVCMHMLDIGLDHMPNNHIVTTPPPQLLPNAQLFQV